jgi:hypothetical protein
VCAFGGSFSERTSRHSADDGIDEGELGKHVEVNDEQRPAVRN